MRYRVQYSLGRERHTAEVDASSPQEAVVKLRHVRGDWGRPGQPWQVLSVALEPQTQEMPS